MEQGKCPQQAEKPYCVIARVSDELAKVRVAVYLCLRDDPDVHVSLELMRRYYTVELSDYVKESQISFYFDILKDARDVRPERTRLLRDCKKGRYDIIVTRSRERFARFRYEADQIAESLKYLDPPVRVRIESETADQPEFQPEAKGLGKGGVRGRGTRCRGHGACVRSGGGRRRSGCRGHRASRDPHAGYWGQPLLGRATSRTVR